MNGLFTAHSVGLLNGLSGGLCGQDELQSISRSPDTIDGLQYWYAVDKLSGLSNNDAVSTIADLSSKGRNLTQTLTNRATYKTNIQNGKPALLFDGVNDFYQLGFTLNQPCTIICCYKIIVAGAGVHIYDGFSSANTNSLMINNPTTTLLQVTSSSSFSWSPSDILASRITTINFNGSNSKIYDNGVLQNSTTLGGFGANPSGIVLGRRQDAALFANFYLFEMFAYDKTPTDQERLRVEKYLNQKYKL